MNNKVGIIATGGEVSGIPVLRSLQESGMTNYLFIENKNSPLCFSKSLNGGIFTFNSNSSDIFKKIYYACLKFKIFRLIILDEEIKYMFIKNKEKLKFIKVILPSNRSYEISLNKSKSNSYVEKLGIPVPRTYPIDSKKDLDNFSEEMHYPLVIKGERGTSSSHVRYARNLAELKKYYEEVFRLDKKIDPSSSPPIIQQFIGGPTYLSQAFVNEGSVKVVIPHYKYREWPLSGGVTARAKTISSPKIKKYMTAILESLEWNGEAGMEWKYDSTSDEFYFIEINPRFEGSLDIAIKAGIDIPKLLIKKMDNKFVSDDLIYQINTHYRWFFRFDFKCILNGSSSIFSLFLDSLNPRVHGEVTFDDLNVLRSLWKDPIYDLVNFIRNKK